MKTEELNQQQTTEEQYIAPAIEIFEIELQHNILQASGGSGDGDSLLPDIGDGGDAF
ncbi:MAG: hypothetical protein ACOYEG_09060 [Petrimonas sp.]|jgi:hypothetical protein